MYGAGGARGGGLSGDTSRIKAQEAAEPDAG